MSARNCSDGDRGALDPIASRLARESDGARTTPDAALIDGALAALPPREAAARRYGGLKTRAFAAAAMLLVGAGVLVVPSLRPVRPQPSAAAALSASLRPIPASADAVADVFTAPLRQTARSVRADAAGVLGRLVGPLGGRSGL